MWTILIFLLTTCAIAGGGVYLSLSLVPFCDGCYRDDHYGNCEHCDYCQLIRRAERALNSGRRVS